MRGALGAVLTVMALAAAACGGDDEKSDTKPSEEAVVPADSTVPRIAGDPAATRDPARAGLDAPGRGPAAPPGAAPPRIRGSGDKPLEQFLDTLGHDASAFWQRVFNSSKLEYPPTRQVIVDGAVPSGCGTVVTTKRPFFCPSDDAVFFTLEFFKDTVAPAGDGAIAAVVGRVYGIQVLTLLNYAKARKQGRVTGADIAQGAMCLSGVWLASLTDRLEPGDVEEAAKIVVEFSDKPGDPRSRGTVAENTAAFQKGFRTRVIRDCLPKPR